MNADKRQVEIDKTERKYFDEYISKKAGAEESLGIFDQAEGLVKQGQMDNPMFASVGHFFSPVIDLTPLQKQIRGNCSSSGVIILKDSRTFSREVSAMRNAAHSLKLSSAPPKITKAN